MSDSSNIDEILKSIDALLKDSAAEQRNDDVPASVAKPESAVGEFESAQADKRKAHSLSILPDDTGGKQEDDNAPTDVVVPGIPEESVAAPSLAGKQGQHEHHGKKRLVLSAAMQVEDTPELPLNTASVTQTVDRRADTESPCLNEELVARITAEVCATVQRKLPKVIAPLVEKRLRHYLANADDDNGS